MTTPRDADDAYQDDTYQTENEKPATPPIEVPAERLSADAVDSLIESFILREGTDYGAHEIAHATKQRQVRQQLENGDVKIVFDPDSESVTLMTKRDWLKRSLF